MAQSTTIYLIDKTDGTTAFVIQPKTYDGTGGIQRNTDLTLYGNATPTWGERFNENFYRLLENFAVEESITNPGNPMSESELGGSGRGINKPIVGQLWFNRTTNTLYVYTTGLTWQVVSGGGGGGGYVLKTGDIMSGTLQIYQRGEVLNSTSGLDAILVTDDRNDGDSGLLVQLDDVTRGSFIFSRVDDHLAITKYANDGVTLDSQIILGDGEIEFVGKVTSPSTSPLDSGTTLTTKDYVDSLIGSGGGGGDLLLNIKYKGVTATSQVITTTPEAPFNPVSDVAIVYLNGVKQAETLSYTATTDTITFVASPSIVGQFVELYILKDVTTGSGSPVIPLIDVQSDDTAMMTTSTATGVATITPVVNVANGMVKLNSSGVVPTANLPPFGDITTVSSADTQVLTTNKVGQVVTLTPRTNTANGLLKLDSSGLIPSSLIPSGGSTVAVLTGTIAHGGTIPLPSGYTQAQCKWLVAPYSYGAVEQWAGIDFISCQANSTTRVVTAQYSYDDNPNVYNGTAYYIIVGVK